MESNERLPVAARPLDILLHRQVDHLLSRKNLSDENVLSYFLQGFDGDSQLEETNDGHLDHQFYQNQIERFCDRKRELNRLEEQLSLGRARIHDDGRLLPFQEDDENIPENRQIDEDPNHPPFVANLPNVNNRMMMFPLFLDNGNNDDMHDREQREAQFLRQQQQEAAQAIRRVLLTRYKDAPYSKLELVQPPQPTPQRTTDLTLRRICYAVLVVAGAFVATMVRALPSTFDTGTVSKGIHHARGDDENLMDRLLHTVASVRLPDQHIAECFSLQDRNTRYPWPFQWLKDCSNGVLLVPSLQQSTWHYSNDLTWFRPCTWKNSGPPSCFNVGVTASNAYPLNNNKTVNDVKQCVRGVHDKLLTKEEIAKVISLGKDLSRNKRRAEPFQIHFSDIDRLPSSLVITLRRLLINIYEMPKSIRPVAFRIHASAPLNGDTSFTTKAGTVTQHPLARLLHRQRNYENNASTIVSWPWSWFVGMIASRGRATTNVDACRVLSDHQVDERLQLLTSIYLTDDYSGGSMLFVDDTSDNCKWWWWWRWRRTCRGPIRRGLAVIGQLGRVVVSSGDNSRCQLPVRHGIRAILQVWWSCG
ncbi:hypothetical protein MPSEU_001095000 [Mayamaea pseudoterrestris]|nr:hypothetical protein MPSEU_001095000 [Mayamaea pseudoterrestris]